MAFKKRTWISRVVTQPGRRRLTATGIQNVYDVTRVEGDVIQEGDDWSAENINDLENRIYNEFEDNLTTSYTQITPLATLPTTAVDGSIPNWKLQGNTVVSGNTLVGTKPTKIKSVGKNLFNLQDHIAWLTANGDGVNVTEENGETVVSFDNNDYVADRYPLTLKASTQYTFSFDAKISSSSNGFFVIYYSDGTSTNLTFTDTSFVRKTVTSTSGKTIVSITWSFGSGSYKYYIKNFQLEEGTTATTYEPYKSSEVNIGGVELHKLPNGVADILYSGGDKVQNVKKYTLLSTDVNAMYTAGTNVDTITIPISKLVEMKDSGIADLIATKVMTSKTSPNNNGIGADIAGNYWKHYLNTTSLVITVPKGTYPTVAAAQTALTGMEIIYQTANVVKSNLIDELVMSGQLQSFKGGSMYLTSDTSVIGSISCELPSNKAATIDSNVEAIGSLGKQINEVVDNVNQNTLQKVDKSSIVNNLINTVVGSPLDSTQGTALNNAKFAKANIVDSLNITSNDYLMGGKTASDKFAAIDVLLNKTNLKASSNILTVGKTGAQFTTINDAITYAKTYCSRWNRVLIFIYPGVYAEEINLVNNPGIDLQGSGKEGTIVQYASIYPNAPLYMNGEGKVSDIYFQCLSGSNSYAFHYEIGDTAVTGFTVVKNCMFRSVASAGVGAGLGANCKLILDECSLSSETKEALYFHNNPYSNKENQNIDITNCSFESSLNNVCVSVDDACSMNGNTNSQLYITFKNNTTKIGGKINFRKTGTTSYSYIPSADSNIHLLPDSVGNNLLGLTIEKADINIVGYASKSQNPVPNTTPSYYLYSVPYTNADKYDWSIIDVTVPGVSSITSSCTIDTIGNNYISTKDNSVVGAGYSVQVTLHGTAK